VGVGEGIQREGSCLADGWEVMCVRSFADPSVLRLSGDLAHIGAQPKGYRHRDN
jgi:hypothetical protein